MMAGEGGIPQSTALALLFIDQQATPKIKFTQCFADLEEASEYLAWKRSR